MDDFISDLAFGIPLLPINRVLRVMLQTRWSAEAWPQVKADGRRITLHSRP